MEFESYECLNCESYFQTIDGYRTPDGYISIKCPACRSVDRFEKGNTVTV